MLENISCHYYVESAGDRDDLFSPIPAGIDRETAILKRWTATKYNLTWRLGSAVTLGNNGCLHVHKDMKAFIKYHIRMNCYHGDRPTKKGGKIRFSHVLKSYNGVNNQSMSALFHSQDSWVCGNLEDSRVHQLRAGDRVCLQARPKSAVSLLEQTTFITVLQVFDPSWDWEQPSSNLTSIMPSTSWHFHQLKQFNSGELVSKIIWLYDVCSTCDASSKKGEDLFTECLLKSRICETLFDWDY